MPRISTLAQNQAVVARMLQAQQQVADTQRQVGSGVIADRFKGIAKDANALISAKAIEARTSSYIALGTQVGLRMEVQDAAISNLYEAAKSLREDLLGALANDSGRTLSVNIENAFGASKSVLNTRFAGSYIFAGGRTDTPPFSAVDVPDLATIANPITDYFVNSQQKPQVRLDQSLVIEYGVLADDLGQGLLASVKRLAEYDAATPFGTNLTPADEAIVQAEIANLDQVMSDIIQIQANNGLTQQRVEETIIRHEEFDTVNKGFIAAIEEVDIAEAISRLNRQQLAVEASYSLVRKLNEVSLLDFI
ncbi:MAG TPA: hypothetical protein DCZ07_10315 [Alphaproteobacteria bacterium]|nr:hypothetical protein [Alphaproteobacteria bacterium]